MFLRFDRYKSERERHKKAFHGPSSSPHTDQSETDQASETITAMQHGDSNSQQHFVTGGGDDSQQTFHDDGLEEDGGENGEEATVRHQVVVVTSDADGNTVYTTETGEIIDVRDMDVVGAAEEVVDDDDDDGSSSTNCLDAPVAVDNSTPSPPREVVMVEDAVAGTVTVTSVPCAALDVEMESEDIEDDLDNSEEGNPLSLNGQEETETNGDLDDSVEEDDHETRTENGDDFYTSRYKEIASENGQTFLHS